MTTLWFGKGSLITSTLPPQGTWVVSALRQLHRFAKGFFRTGYHKDQVSYIPYSTSLHILDLKYKCFTHVVHGHPMFLCATFVLTASTCTCVHVYMCKHYFTLITCMHCFQGQRNGGGGRGAEPPHSQN